MDNSPGPISSVRREPRPEKWREREGEQRTEPHREGWRREEEEEEQGREWHRDTWRGAEGSKRNEASTWYDYNSSGTDTRAARRSAGGNSGASMALITAAASLAIGGAGACLYSIRPRDPVFEVKEIQLKGLNLRFCTDSPMLMAVVDVELTLWIKVTNNNVVPIEYTSTIMDIFYRGHLMGQAKVDEGNQEAKSSRVIVVPCKLDGLEMTNHVGDLFKDVRNRVMSLRAVVTISGHARVWKWTNNFEIHVTSDIKVDPIFLKVIDQENKVEMELESPI